MAKSRIELQEAEKVEKILKFLEDLDKDPERKKACLAALDRKIAEAEQRLLEEKEKD